VKKTKFILLVPVILLVIPMTGCNKKETISSSGGKAPVFASEYIGLMKVTRNIIGFPTPKTDSVVLLIDGTDYNLYITGARKTSLCDSRGAFFYSTVAKSVSLTPEGFTFDLCDTLRIPQGMFSATVTETALNFSGFHVVPESTDTVRYDFRLTVAPPR